MPDERDVRPRADLYAEIDQLRAERDASEQLRQGLADRVEKLLAERDAAREELERALEAWQVACGTIDKLTAERDALAAELEDTVKREQSNKRIAQGALQRADKMAAVVEAARGMMDYFEPRGGVSDVPLGPFERIQEALAALDEDDPSEIGGTQSRRRARDDVPR